MNEFGQKGNASDEDFMIHVQNNLREEYEVTLNGLENRLMAIRENALVIDTMHKKLNHRYEKSKIKRKKNTKKKKY